MLRFKKDVIDLFTGFTGRYQKLDVLYEIIEKAKKKSHLFIVKKHFAPLDTRGIISGLFC